MKNRIKLCLATTLIFTFLHINSTQAQAYESGQVSVSAGIGLNTYGFGLSGLGFVVPAIANVDYGFNEYISFGGYLGYWRSSYTSFGSDFSLNSIYFGGRGSFHFLQLLEDELDTDFSTDKIDAYISLWLGYNIRSYTSDIAGANLDLDNRVHIGGQFGIRYYFKENLAVFLELGGTPVSYSVVGLAYKF